MSIGRIEMVDGVKKNVVYATLGGTGGIQVGNVQDLSIEENADNLTLKWKDPDNVIFNGETIAEWGGTKVVRKEGSSPESVTDGTLVVDSTVKDQYAVEGLQDTDVLDDSQYNYALFPYTTKNVYTMSDLNRASSGFGGYDPIFENNSWSKIAKASREGTASNIWSVGDVKDDIYIFGFDHDDLSDGSGKAGITFAAGKAHQFMGKISDSYVPYPNLTLLNSNIDTFKSGLPSEIVENVRKVTKQYTSRFNSYTDYSISNTDVDFFLPSTKEIVGTHELGERYEYCVLDKKDCFYLSTSNTQKYYYTRNMVSGNKYRDFRVLSNGFYDDVLNITTVTDIYFMFLFCL